MPVALRMRGAAELVVGLEAAALRDRSRRGGGRCVHYPQASGHRRGGRSAPAVPRPSASTWAAACGLIDDHHRQVPGRVDDRAEVDRRMTAVNTAARRIGAIETFMFHRPCTARMWRLVA
jgi:hypothetical protein